MKKIFVGIAVLVSAATAQTADIYDLDLLDRSLKAVAAQDSTGDRAEDSMRAYYKTPDAPAAPTVVIPAEVTVESDSLQPSIDSLVRALSPVASGGIATVKKAVAGGRLTTAQATAAVEQLIEINKLECAQLQAAATAARTGERTVLVVALKKVQAEGRALETYRVSLIPVQNIRPVY